MRLIRLIAISAVVASLGATAPAFADAGGPYKLDAKGKCHDVKGGFAATDKCKAAAAAKPAGKCRDAKGHFTKCGTPGAKPA